VFCAPGLDKKRTDLKFDGTLTIDPLPSEYPNELFEMVLIRGADDWLSGKKNTKKERKKEREREREKKDQEIFMFVNFLFIFLFPF